MTKIIYRNTDHNIYFDCVNHADDHDVCTIVSTLVNVLVAECLKSEIAIKTYEPGHVTISAENANEFVSNAFETVNLLLSQVAEEYKSYVKLY